MIRQMRSVVGKPKPSAGFTLIELVVTTGVFSTMIAALMFVYADMQDSYTLSSANSYLQQEGRRAFHAMTRELRESGRVRRQGDTSGQVNFSGQSQIDFQIARSYDLANCSGTCWGDDTANARWLHYLLDQSDTSDVRLVRCSTANQTDAVDLSGCQVLTNYVESFQADYDHSQLAVTLHLSVRQTSPQFRGGSATASSSSLTDRVKIRNGG